MLQAVHASWTTHDALHRDLIPRDLYSLDGHPWELPSAITAREIYDRKTASPIINKTAFPTINPKNSHGTPEDK
jgi:hypothetical protein